jgi:hypothetical protein
MAMRTKTASPQAVLKRRIKRFYALLNTGDFQRCFEMIDPRIRAKPSSVTLLQYENSLRDFLQAVKSVEVQSVSVELHLNEPSRLYEDRDFAVGTTRWNDARGNVQQFAERWVREGRTWYTRSTGLLNPEP